MKATSASLIKICEAHRVNYFINKSQSGFIDIFLLECPYAKAKEIRAEWREAMKVQMPKHQARFRKPWPDYIGHSAMVEHPFLGDLIITSPSEESLGVALEEMFGMNVNKKLVRKCHLKHKS